MAQDMFIAGSWQQAGGTPITSTSPAGGAVLWEGRTATGDDVDAAVAAAQSAFPAWDALGHEARAAIVDRFTALVGEEAEGLARLIAQETGKALWDASGEVKAVMGKAAISKTAFAERTPSWEKDLGPMRAKLTHRPHGVAVVFGPYNFPAHLPNGHIVPALLAGNTVVFKPSEQCPAVAAFMVDLWARAGLPSGVLNMVNGLRETGEALTAHPDIRALFFTGSVPTGRAIARTLIDRPEVMLALELGGNNPLIIGEVANLQAAALTTINSAFITTGQRCTCARRLIVPEGPGGDAFVSALLAVMDKVRIGDPLADDQPYMGPLISAVARSAVLAAQDALIAKGAKALKPATASSLGDAYITPGLIDVTDAVDVPDEEIFGPILQLVRVADLAEAVDIANDTAFGLSAGILTDDADAYAYFAAKIRAGIVNWNQQLTGASSAAPFGGIGQSGNFRPSAYYAADYAAYPAASIENPAGRLTEVAVPTGVDL